jgi:hypothetical protein
MDDQPKQYELSTELLKKLSDIYAIISSGGLEEFYATPTSTQSN